MKKEPYMSKNELLDWLKMGVLAGEAESIANRTPVPEWRKKLKCIATYARKIVNERIAVVEKKQLPALSRRQKHSTLMLYTSDQIRLNEDNIGKPETSITLATDDAYDLVDFALLSCAKCPQGGVVAGCKMRDVYHRIGVEPMRTNPAEGECEFKLDNEIRCITPQYERVRNEEHRI